MNLHTSDLLIILKVLANYEGIIITYDPTQQLTHNTSHSFHISKNLEGLYADFQNFKNKAICFINLSDEHPSDLYNHPATQFIFIPNRKVGLENWQFERFGYVNNPDKTIRWIYPKTAKYPSFLTLYNASSFKAKLIKQAFIWTFRLGLHGRLTSGWFSFFYKNSLTIAPLLKEANAESYSIFTGTVGENRKAIIEINQNRRTTQFIKYPLSSNSFKLVEQEKNVLEQLAAYQFKNTVVPTLTPSNNKNVAILSNVQPPRQSATLMELSPIHYQALGEWYKKTAQTQKIKTLPSFQQIEKCLKALVTRPAPVNDLDTDKIDELIEGLKQIYKKLKTVETLQTAVTHGDFTPWNMYVGKTKLHVYDWELSRNDLPLLFDAFHFIFQSNILIKRTPFQDFKSVLTGLKATSTLQLLGQTPAIKANLKEKFDDYYDYYLLFNVGYYLNLYVRQAQLHLQAHWLIDTWHDAIKERIA